jgi:hypothetical protein
VLREADGVAALAAASTVPDLFFDVDAEAILAAADRARADVFADPSAFERAEALSDLEKVGVSGAFDHAEANQPVRASSHSGFRRWTLANLPASAADRDRG